jgi:hypothetical protein
MNDPEIVGEPMPLREVHAIRLMIYDDTKDMTKDERKAYYNKGLAEAQAQYKLKIASK